MCTVRQHALGGVEGTLFIKYTATTRESFARAYQALSFFFAMGPCRLPVASLLTRTHLELSVIAVIGIP